MSVKAKSAADLVNNPRLFSYAMTAFGLGDRLYAKALMTQVLQQGVGDAKALANKLNDRRFREMAADLQVHHRRRGDRGGARRLDGARHDQSALQFVARHECRQLHVVGDDENRGFGRDADVGAETRAAPELAGLAGGPGGVHADLLAGAVVAQARNVTVREGQDGKQHKWQLKVTRPPPANTSFTT